MKKFLSRIKNPGHLIAGIIRKLYFLFPNDIIYLKIIFRLEMGYFLNLKEPKTFNEKIQWLKIYDRKPEYTFMVDKYEVKKYVANKIGEEYIIPTIGVWSCPDEIDWKSLPDQFVLKTTHGGGGGGVIICKDKKNEYEKRITVGATGDVGYGDLSPHLSLDIRMGCGARTDREVAHSLLN